MEIIINFESLDGKFANRSTDNKLLSIQLVGINQSNTVTNFVTKHKEYITLKRALLKKIIVNNTLRF